MQWIDGEIKAVKGLARRVSKLASAMKAESWGVSECVLDRARGGERVVLRQGGRAVAALVPIADLKLLQKLEDEKDLRDIRAARIEMKRKGTIPWGKVKGELGLQWTPVTPQAAGTKPSRRSRRLARP
jgi:antitoxin (DNA-binding transcriptional repressor) of toxin-antitoxin stability system